MSSRQMALLNMSAEFNARHLSRPDPCEWSLTAPMSGISAERAWRSPGVGIVAIYGLSCGRLIKKRSNPVHLGRFAEQRLAKRNRLPKKDHTKRMDLIIF